MEMTRVLPQTVGEDPGSLRWSEYRQREFPCGHVNVGFLWEGKVKGVGCVI